MTNNADWPGWTGAIAAAAGIVWLFFKHLFSSVTRSEFEQTLQRLHQENTNRLESINDTVTRTHQRIDELYRDMMSRR